MASYTTVLLTALFIVLFQNDLYVLCDVKRDVTTVPWPNCSKYKSCENARILGVLPNVVYVKAKAKNNDALHYVFSTIGVPTLLLAHTVKGDADMNFNWDKILSKDMKNAITTTGKGIMEYQTAVAFTKLIEYDDMHDTADLEDYAKKDNKDQQWNIRTFNTSWWQQLVLDSKNKNSFSFSTHNNYTSPISNETQNGNLTFTFRVPNSAGRDSGRPNLKYFTNETLFDFILANYTPAYTHSRFGLEVLVVSKSSKSESKSSAVSMSIKESQSLDDEYSPGVFRITNWSFDKAYPSKRGYMQWRPVCYLGTSRDRSVMSKVKDYKMDSLGDRPNERDLLNNSIAYAVFGDTLWEPETFHFATTNISFGLPKDGFYVKTNYTVWTAAVGYGAPPDDGISMTVIIIIACGLGLPVLIIILGGVYVVTKKIRRRSEGYYAIDSPNVNSGISHVN